jgi:hypothetical protein
MPEARELTRRSNAARASLIAVGLTDAAAIPAGLAYASYLESLDPAAVVADLELVSSELAYALLGLAQVAAMIVAAILFMRWFHFAHRNLQNFCERPAAYDSRWAIWGFFVPILNLIRPHALMREIWTLTSSRWQADPSRVAGLTRPSDRVNLWWGFFVATTVLGNAAGRADWRATTAQESLWATWGLIFANAFDIAAVLAAMALVRSVSELQRPFMSHVQSGPAA